MPQARRRRHPRRRRRTPPPSSSSAPPSSRCLDRRRGKRSAEYYLVEPLVKHHLCNKTDLNALSRLPPSPFWKSLVDAPPPSLLIPFCSVLLERVPLYRVLLHSRIFNIEMIHHINNGLSVTNCTRYFWVVSLFFPHVFLFPV